MGSYKATILIAFVRGLITPLVSGVRVQECRALMSRIGVYFQGFTKLFYRGYGGVKGFSTGALTVELYSYKREP